MITNQDLADVIHIGIADIGMAAVGRDDVLGEAKCHALADAFDELCERVGLEGLFDAAPRITKELMGE